MDLREECMEQALALLSEQGIKFTMSDLAARLGISKKTIYKVFDSKEAMLTAVADHGFKEIKQSEKQVLSDPSLSLLERVRRLIIVIPKQYQNLNWYRMQEVAEKYPDIYEYIKKRMESDWEPTLQLLEEGMKTGILRSFDLGIFKSMVEGCMEHFLTSSDLNDQGIAYTEALEQMMDILLLGVAVETC